MQNDINEEGDIIGMFSPGEYATLDEGSVSECPVMIIEINEEGICKVVSEAGLFEVNILRLSK